MIIRLDQFGPRATMSLGFRSGGQGPAAEVSVFDEGSLALHGTFDYPSFWTFKRCAEHVGSMLDAQCQQVLGELEPHVALWEEAARFLV